MLSTSKHLSKRDWGLGIWAFDVWNCRSCAAKKTEIWLVNENEI